MPHASFPIASALRTASEADADGQRVPTAPNTTTDNDIWTLLDSEDYDPKSIYDSRAQVTADMCTITAESSKESCRHFVRLVHALAVRDKRARGLAWAIESRPREEDPLPVFRHYNLDTVDDQDTFFLKFVCEVAQRVFDSRGLEKWTLCKRKNGKLPAEESATEEPQTEEQPT